MSRIKRRADALQGPVRPLELPRVRVALLLDQGALADPRIGLAQSHPMLPGEPHQPLAGAVHQPGVGRERNRLLLHCRVDDHVPEIGRLGGAGAGCGREALLKQRREPLLAHAPAPARQRRAIDRKPMPEKLLAAEELKVRVLDPARAQRLVGEVMQVLEDGQPRHQAGRQRRPAGAVLINRPEALFQERPIDRLAEPHQPVPEVEHLLEPGTEQVLLARLPALPWSHRRPAEIPTRAANHAQKPQSICQKTYPQPA